MWGAYMSSQDGLKRLPQLPSFHTKPQVLEIHKYEKNFKGSHNSLTRWKF
jgi:hypothetical protein